MIYVASSWRNPHYGGILDCLEQWNIAYYNWRDAEGFHWSEVIGVRDEKDADHWTSPMPVQEYTFAMSHPRSQAGFARDMDHLERAEAVILLLECGKSAHLEAGWAVGAGKPVALYMPAPLQPELMYGMFNLMTGDIEELMRWADRNTNERILGPNKRDVYADCSCGAGNQSIAHAYGCTGFPVIRTGLELGL